jgi:hypothetical protein
MPANEEGAQQSPGHRAPSEYANVFQGTVYAAESSCARKCYDIVVEGSGKRCTRVEENRGALKRQHGAFGPPRSSRVDRMIRSRSVRVVRLSVVRDEHERKISCGT